MLIINPIYTFNGKVVERDNDVIDARTEDTGVYLSEVLEAIVGEKVKIIVEILD